MANPKPLQIFKPGKHTALSGVALAFSESDLAASARAYDPALSEAPLVVGHPRLDAPAYGWVKSLAFSDSALEAQPDQVEPAFAEMVAAGRFKKISASFYPPDSPNNPVPGVYYLRHVGFLGAAAPAVKGLRMPEFSEADESITFEFGEYDDVRNAELWRSLRDWMIGKFGQDEADKVVPGYTVSSLEQSAQDELREDAAESGTASPIFAEQPNKEVSSVTPEQKAALEAENAQLKSDLASLKTAQIHSAHAAFAEQLVAAGQLMPAQVDIAVATLDFFAGQEIIVEFGEGDAKAPLIDGFKTFLSGLPKRLDFSETATNAAAAGEGNQAVEFAAPQGYAVDAESMVLHRKALAHQAAHKTDYISAVKAVSAQS
jgi:hypothetical protein